MFDTVNSGAYGTVRVRQHRKSDGRLIFDKTFKNQIQTFAVQQAASMWAGNYVLTPSQIQVGTGSPPAGQSGTTPNDGGLWTPMAGTLKRVDYAIVFLSVYTQWSVTYQQNEAIGTVTTGNPHAQITLTEAALLDANGNCWSHVQLTGVAHDNTSTLSIQWQILQQGD
jgi:hypothetical protein